MFSPPRPRMRGFVNGGGGSLACVGMIDMCVLRGGYITSTIGCMKGMKVFNRGMSNVCNFVSPMNRGGVCIEEEKMRFSGHNNKVNIEGGGGVSMFKRGGGGLFLMNNNNNNTMNMNIKSRLLILGGNISTIQEGLLMNNKKRGAFMCQNIGLLGGKKQVYEEEEKPLKNTIKKRFFVSWFDDNRGIDRYKGREISTLQNEAYMNPLDISLGLKFMKEANKYSPILATQYYEQFHRHTNPDDSLYREYIRSFVLGDNMSSITRSSGVSMLPSMSSTSSYYGGGGGGILSSSSSGGLNPSSTFSTNNNPGGGIINHEQQQQQYTQQQNNPSMITTTNNNNNNNNNRNSSSASETGGGGGGWFWSPSSGLRGESGSGNNNNNNKNNNNGGSIILPQKEPLKVVMVERSQDSFWRVLKSCLWLLIIVSGVSVLIEGLSSNVQKGFGLSSKKIVPVKDIKTCFDDVKGCDEVKEEVREIILYLKDPEKFTRLGAQLPKGMLLSGPPGTGKTLLARAMAGEAKVPFIQTSGSDFEEMFVGVGAKRIRELFNIARKHSPCIVFIDELDAVGSARTRGDNNAVRMTLNQLLVELDGFEPNTGIVVICATNFLESLDPALTRPGRLDKIVNIPLPDYNGRSQILQLYAHKILLHQDVDLSLLAKRTSGMTGADLFNILNIAAIKSSSNGQNHVHMYDLEQAFDRVVAGLEQHTTQSQEDLMLTAIHESGHTLVNYFSKSPLKLHKATIMRRGQALGITWSIPDKEIFSQNYEQYLAQLDILMAGKAAEEFVYGPQNVTSGCMSDLKSATSLARSMVTKFGMGMETSKVPMFVDSKTSNISQSYSEKIDKAVQTILDEAYKRAYDIIKSHETELNQIASALMDFETLDLKEIELAMKGEKGEIERLRKEGKKDF